MSSRAPSRNSRPRRPGNLARAQPQRTQRTPKLPADVLSIVFGYMIENDDFENLAALHSSSTMTDAIEHRFRTRLVICRSNVKHLLRALPRISQKTLRTLKGGESESKYRSDQSIDPFPGWPELPCPSDSDSEIELPLLVGPGHYKSSANAAYAGRKSLATSMVKLCRLATSVEFAELPNSSACAALLAVAQSIGRPPLFQRAETLSLGAGVYEGMIDWMDRHGGNQHPLDSFRDVGFKGKHLCYDSATTITRDQFVASRIGWTRQEIGDIAYSAKAALLRSAWSEKRRSPLPDILSFSGLSHSKDSDSSISTHNAQGSIFCLHSGLTHRVFLSTPIDFTSRSIDEKIISSLCDTFDEDSDSGFDDSSTDTSDTISRDDDSDTSSPSVRLSKLQLIIPDDRIHIQEEEDLERQKMALVAAINRKKRNLLYEDQSPLTSEQQSRISIAYSRTAAPCVCCGRK